MTKPKAPDTSFLFLVLHGYSDRAKKSGYLKAKSVTEDFLAVSELAVEGAGGRLLTLEGDILSACFLDLPRAGVQAAVRAGLNALSSLIKGSKGMKKTPVSALVHAQFIGKDRVRKDLSNLEALSRPALRQGREIATSLRPGTPLALTEAAVSNGGPHLRIKAHPGIPGLHVLTRFTGPKARPKKGPRAAEKEDIAANRLRSQLKEVPVPFSVVALRVRKSRGKGVSGAAPPRDPFQRAREVASLLGGEPLKGPRDILFALFSGPFEASKIAASAVRCAATAMDDLDEWFARKRIKGVVGGGVASGTVPHGLVEKRSGEPFRKVLGAARSLAAPRQEKRPRVDGTTAERIRIWYGVKTVDTRKGGGKAYGLNPLTVFHAGDLTPPDFVNLGLGPSTRKVRDFFRKAVNSGKCRLLSAEAEEESLRTLGMVGLSETAHRLGWIVLSHRCGPESNLHPLGVWKEIVAGVVGFDPLDDAERVATLLARALERYVPKREDTLLWSLLEFYHAGGKSPGLEMIPPQLKRRLIEKGLFLLISGILSEHPTLILILDGHLGDDDSMDFLQRCRETMTGFPVVFAVTHAPSFTLHKPDLSVSLKPLTADQCLLLTRSILRTKELSKELKSLVQRLGGNPFRIWEALVALEERGKIFLDQGKCSLVSAGIPKDLTLRGVVHARLKAAPPPLRKSLVTAAILGSQFEGRLISALDSETSLRTLLTLEKGGWLVPTRHGESGEWTFGHAEIRERALASLNAKERAAVHAQASSALKKIYGPREGEVAHRIAWHRKEEADRPEMTDALVKLGKDAKSMGFPFEAEICFREVLHIPRPNDLTKAGLMFERAEALSDLGRTDEAVAQLETALKSKAVRIPKKKKSQAPS